MNLFRCLHCGSWIDADLSELTSDAAGTEDDPRPPGDWDNVCADCNYRLGRRGTPPPMTRDNP